MEEKKQFTKEEIEARKDEMIAKIKRRILANKIKTVVVDDEPRILTEQKIAEYRNINRKNIKKRKIQKNSRKNNRKKK